MKGQFDTFCTGLDRRRDSLLDVAEKLRQAVDPSLPKIEPPKPVTRRLMYFKISARGAVEERFIDPQDEVAIKEFFADKEPQ